MKLNYWMGVAVMAIAPSLAFAANYPERPIALVIPYAPGGPTDVFGRVVAEELAQRMGGTVVVENRAGAAGGIGMTHVARAPADGYTLLFGDINLAVGKLVNPNLPIDVSKDLAPVGFVGTAPMLLLTTATNPANSVDELVQAIRQSPGKYSYGSGGHGSPTHLGPELLKSRQGLDLLMVTYKGSGPALTALAAGEVDVMMTGMSASRPFIEGKRIKALGILGTERSSEMPSLPTLKEQGYDLPELDMGSWWGIMAPAGTPEAVVKKLNSTIAAAMNDAQLKARIAKLNIQPRTSSPEEFSEFITSQTTAWSELIKPAN